MSNSNPSAAMPPSHQIGSMMMSLWVSQAVHAAAELGVADVLAEEPLSGRVVAERLDTHPEATERLLRALVVLEVLVLRGERYELTALGRCLQSRAPDSRRAWARLLGSADVWRAWGRLVECVRTGRPAFGGTGAAASETEVFDTYARDPQAAAVFHQAMADFTRGTAPGVVGAVDVRGARRVVDVGGGYGELLCAFLEAHREMSGSVFDLAAARVGALELFAARGLAARASFVTGDFFATALPAADLVLLNGVVHDWDDARGRRILASCRAALTGPDARLLLVELPAPDERGAGPLEWLFTFSDLNMLVNTGGRERTADEYRALLETSGLRVVGVHATPGLVQVFEAVRA
jgi:hypothetical protein